MAQPVILATLTPGQPPAPLLIDGYALPDTVHEELTLAGAAYSTSERKALPFALLGFYRMWVCRR
jgi:hypothetical protein